jgi:hypothetical protein
MINEVNVSRALRGGVLLVWFAAMSASATAAEIDTASDVPVEIHGFVSQGAMLSTANNYLQTTI